METALFAGGLIQLIVIICFFVLVARVGAIKTLIEAYISKPDYIKNYEAGELAEFLGKTEEAREQFKIAQFRAGKISGATDVDKRNLMKIEQKIKELGS